MRRSRSVIAPLLAAAAAAAMHGGARAQTQPTPVTMTSSSNGSGEGSTAFGGFGQSFAEHPAPWIGAAVATLFVLGAGS
ncbi:hypothetical protein SAMN05421819_2364 [Bryocella elongata]|uniref:Uncharacterized protein n=1 Tax=Bryocella elongata TaxID=863522 RepID=A0A1H5YKH9_9BACT|nr:hypothetical protein [Bryocella elongata]SEG24578.1 hypothetical protein SAMN05421819_2364 [Bryocella elongata]